MTTGATDLYYIPARRHLEVIWPHDLLSIPDLSALDSLWIRPGVPIVADDGSAIELNLAAFFERTLELGLPGFDLITVSLGDPSSGVDIPVKARLGTGQFSLTIGPVPVALNLRGQLLVRAEDVSTDPAGPRVFEARPDLPLSVQVGLIELTWRSDGRIEIAAAPALNLPYAMLGDSGIVVAAADLRLIFSPAAAALLPLEVVHQAPGLYLGTASVYFPDELAGVIPDDVQVTGAYVGPGGLSATIAGNWSPTWDPATGVFTGNDRALSGDLLDLPFAVEKVQMTIEHNQPVECVIEGLVLVPYFDEPVAVGVRLGIDGDFQLTLRSADADGLVVRKEDLLALTIKELSIRKDADVGTLVLSGGLQPLLMASDGLQWPRLDVNGLEIDTNGRFLIREAWLDLKELASLDLFGFQFELSRIGIGYEEATDSLWVDLTGSIRLIEQIPVGLGVEGFRIAWPRTLYEDLGLNGAQPLSMEDVLQIASRIEVRFAGIQIFFGVPQAVEFEGLIRFFKEAQVVGFAGDMALRVPATGFAAEAGLMLGINFEDPPYPFLYLYLGVELPAGIPLGQSGLALKRAQGLFGLNVEPARDAPQNWFFDWYKGAPAPGADQTTKWRYARSALALGIGVTITTVDGYVKGVRGLIVLALPGPILILEGRSLILDGLLPAEPPFRALAVFDGVARTVQFNLEAEGVIVEDMLEAYAQMEAFFDFADLTNWHLYLGQDQPAERRVRASVLKFGSAFLFDANAFLMLDMIGGGTLRARMGLYVGFEPPIPSFGPVRVDFKGTIEGGAEVTLLPEQFSGDVLLSAEVGISTFGFSCRVAIDADLMAEGPDPFAVEADLHIKVELPQPLEALDDVPLIGDAMPEEPLPPIEVELHFEWQSAPNLRPESPMVEAMVEGFTASAHHTLKLNTTPIDSAVDSASGRPSASDMRTFAEKSPVVPMDSAPLLGFAHNMNDSTGGTFARHPDGQTFRHRLGRLRLTPAVHSIRIYRHRRRDAWTNNFAADWTLVATTVTGDGTGGSERMPLYGVWHADADTADAENVAVRRLRLWSTDPFSHTRGALGPGYGGIAHALGETVVSEFLRDHPYYYTPELEPQEICIDPPRLFGAGKHPTGDSREDKGLTVFLQGDSEVNHQLTCLRSLKGTRLRFDRAVRRISIVVCDLPAGGLRGEVMATRPGRLQQTGAPGRFGLDFSLPTTVRPIDPALLRQPVLTRQAVEIQLEIIGDRAEITARQGFDELTIKAGVGIARICWIPDEELERAERAGTQGDVNDDVTDLSGAEPPVLEPDCYYRLEVVASSTAELIPSSGPLGSALDALYEAGLQALTGNSAGGTNHFFHDSYFQTQLPPTDLMPYVASSYPAAGEKDVLRGDDFAIRFRRPNLHAMFGGVYAPELMLLGPDGRAVRGYETAWSKARSSTLHYDERVWLLHLNLNPDDANGPLPDDDLLVFRRKDLFRDDFASRGLNGWTLQRGPTTNRMPEIRVTNGTVQVTRSETHRGSAELPSLLTGGPIVNDYTVTAVLTLPAAGTGGLAVRVAADGSHYLVMVNATHVVLERVSRQGGRALSDVLSQAQHGRQLGGEHELMVTVAGADFTVELDGRQVLAAIDRRPLLPGRIGLVVGAAGAAYRSVRVSAAAPALLPGTRYELVVRGGAGGRILSEGGSSATAYRDIAAFIEVRPGTAPAGISLRGGAVQVRVTSTSLSVVDASGADLTAPVAVSLDAAEFYPLRVDSIGEDIVVVLNGVRRADAKIPDGSPPAGPVAAIDPATCTRAFVVREGALLRLPFTTSRFTSFRALAAVVSSEPSITFLVTDTPTPFQIAALDSAARDLERGVVSLRDQLIDRAAFEGRRLTEREARAVHDEVVHAIALAAGAQVFGALPTDLALHLAFSGADAGSPLRAICLSAPESLQPRHNLYGRTSLTLESRPNTGAAWSTISTRWTWSGDGTLVVALPSNDPHRASGSELRIRMTYARDLGDSAATVDHRFDRPVRRRGGRADAEEATIVWRRRAND